MSKPVIQEQVWAGTEASLSEYFKLSEAMEAKLVAGMPGMPDNEEDKCKPYLLNVQDGVGIISIRGPLTNRDNWMTRMFEVSTYPAIREALVSAANDAEVKQILLDIDSGGGAVSGVADVANLISTIHAKVKPVTSFTDGTMASAAYWLGCSGGNVYASKVATVGSIGVIATHMEQSKMLKDEGIGVTVMRSGKYKALANSVEPLTAAAKEQMQSQLDAAYQVFVQHVAEARNTSYDHADQQMAQGREFFGSQGVSAGLIDGVESFDSLFSRISSDTIDNKTHMGKNPQGFQHSGMSGQSEATMAGRQALTEQQIAALAETATVTGEAPAAPVTEAVSEHTAQAPEAHAAEAHATQAQAAGSDQLVSYLQAQVKERDEALMAAKVQVATLTEKSAAAEAVVGDLLAIAGKSLNNMQVALGGTAIDLSAYTPLAVIGEHKRVSTQFMDKFKAGGVAAVDATQAEKGEDVVVDSLTRARLAATTLNKSK